MKEQHIETRKTARVYTMGELSERTKHVWIVLHGFGQNAKNFLMQFDPLSDDKVFFIAPEALNRFYLKGADGKVGATWMTKEDRLNEVKDYINYLDDIYELFELERFAGMITVLGFSQGASTVSRWVNSTQNKINTLIIYAGEVAPELLPLHKNSGLKRTHNIFIRGDEDEIFTAEVVSQLKELYKELNFVEIEFQGKHVINPAVLKKYLQ